MRILYSYTQKTLVNCEHLFYFWIIYGEQLHADRHMLPDLVIHCILQALDLLRLHGGSVQFNVAPLTPQFPKTGFQIDQTTFRSTDYLL